MSFRFVYWLFVFLLSELPVISNAQTDTLSWQHAIHLEMGGAGGYASVNYEHLLLKKQRNALLLKAGIGLYHLQDFKNNFNPDILIPLSFHFLWGREHLIELACGESFHSIVKNNIENYTPVRQQGMSSFAVMGYRYQRAGGRVILRVFYNPLLEFNTQFRHWAGVSFGYAF